jgi:predicted transposase YdaD
MSEVTANYDESWKEALNEYFESFLCFFFPLAHEAIDWTQKPESLDKELQEITASAKTERRIADKLYKVWLLDKQQIWILIHIEIQSQYDVDFEERIYIYNYRAFDLYHKFVVSLAILGDTSPTWRPNSYNQAMLDCELRLKFPIAKLLDYESRWHELESNPNPFAIIVMAHLKTKATTGNFSEREKWKWQLIRGLYERGLTKEQIVKLFKIIDKMMTLPKQLQAGLVAKIKHFEEEQQMPFISPTEELAMERGEQKGIQQGIQQGIQREQQLIIRQLNRRIGEIQSSLIDTIRTLTIEQLELLGEALLDFSSVTDLEQWLENNPES